MTVSSPLHSAPLAFGDLQGCRTQFQQLLAKAAPAPDTPLWFAGDLINRGGESLATLRDIIAFGDRAKPVLGNHDLHLLSVSAGIRKSKKGDTIDQILAAPDAKDLLHWVRHRPLAYVENDMLLVHAGVLPQWDLTITLELADELEGNPRGSLWQRAKPLEARPERHRPSAPDLYRTHPDALLQFRRRDGFQHERRPQFGAAGIRPVVRCAVAQDR